VIVDFVDELNTDLRLMKCSVDRKPLSVQYILQVNENTRKPHEIEFT